MKKAWKTILIIALCILIVGEIVLGVGLATGGSPDRIWDAAYEHYDIACRSSHPHQVLRHRGPACEHRPVRKAKNEAASYGSPPHFDLFDL
ncbi:MAG: hypothetical protein V8S57_00190 [Oscillospiraceae bacterium]